MPACGVFSHPRDAPEYRQLHQDFSRKHPWFSYTNLKGETHFPSIELPQEVCSELEDMIKGIAG
jgi:hypothetical protein